MASVSVADSESENPLSLKKEREALGRHASRHLTSILSMLSKDDAYSNAEITTILRNAHDRPGNRSPSVVSEDDVEAEQTMPTPTANRSLQTVSNKVLDAVRWRRPSEAGASMSRRTSTASESPGTCFGSKENNEGQPKRASKGSKGSSRPQTQVNVCGSNIDK